MGVGDLTGGAFTAPHQKTRAPRHRGDLIGNRALARYANS